jgi:magnesium and cobalt exporter, CNNM family
VLSRLGRVPSVGDHSAYEGADDHWRFEVVDMDGHRIDKVLVSKVDARAASANAAAISEEDRRTRPGA